MFPRMRQRLGSALRDNLDLLVEFSTLGEYGLMDSGEARPPAHAGRVSTEPAARAPLPTGTTACEPRRARGVGPASPVGRAAPRRQRGGAPQAPEQVCVTAGSY